MQCAYRAFHVFVLYRSCDHISRSVNNACQTLYFIVNITKHKVQCVRHFTDGCKWISIPAVDWICLQCDFLKLKQKLLRKHRCHCNGICCELISLCWQMVTRHTKTVPCSVIKLLTKLPDTHRLWPSQLWLQMLSILNRTVDRFRISFAMAELLLCECTYVFYHTVSQ